MGRKMIKSMAADWLHSSMSINFADEGSRKLFETEASLGYLCNLPPHRFVVCVSFVLCLAFRLLIVFIL